MLTRTAVQDSLQNPCPSIFPNIQGGRVWCSWVLTSQTRVCFNGIICQSDIDVFEFV